MECVVMNVIKQIYRCVCMRARAHTHTRMFFWMCVLYIEMKDRVIVSEAQSHPHKNSQVYYFLSLSQI